MYEKSTHLAALHEVEGLLPDSETASTLARKMLDHAVREIEVLYLRTQDNFAQMRKTFAASTPPPPSPNLHLSEDRELVMKLREEDHRADGEAMAKRHAQTLGAMADIALPILTAIGVREETAQRLISEIAGKTPR